MSAEPGLNNTINLTATSYNTLSRQYDALVKKCDQQQALVRRAQKLLETPALLLFHTHQDKDHCWMCDVRQWMEDANV
jgi:hypothetical protein